MLQKYFFILVLFSTGSFAKAQTTDLNQLLLGFGNTEPFKEYGFSLKQCQTGQFGNQPVKTQKRIFSENVTLDKDCRPDTLYSWGPVKKVENLKQQMGNGPWADKFSRKLFASNLPVATYYYGDVPIRIKLKKNLKFKQLGNNDCWLGKKNTSTREIREYQTTVYFDVRAIEIGEYIYDFIICSPDVIESWSYGEKEHYNEVIRDLKWITNRGNRGQYVSYIQLETGEPGIDINFNGTPFIKYYTHTEKRPETQWLDGHPVDEKSLIENLTHFYKSASENRSEIFFNPDSNETKTEAEHFSTKNKIYFND